MINDDKILNDIDLKLVVVLSRMNNALSEGLLDSIKKNRSTPYRICTLRGYLS